MNEKEMIELLGIELEESASVEEVVNIYMRKINGLPVESEEADNTYTDEEWEEIIKEFL